MIQEWFEAEAADGFNIMPPVLPSGLDAFVDHVIPILRDRGLFRGEYTGRTLREHHGLPDPGIHSFRSGRPVQPVRHLAPQRGALIVSER